MGIRPRCSTGELEGTVNKGPWSSVEDKVLVDYIRVHGVGRWAKLPKRAGLNRSGKSCRLRWLNYLRPDIKRGNISLEEEDLIIRLHKLLGNRWSLIAGRIPGRTDNEIKNYWNTVLKKKTEQQQDQQRNVDPFLNLQVSKPVPKSPPGDPDVGSSERRRSQLPEDAGDHLRAHAAAHMDDLALLVHSSTSAPEQSCHDHVHSSFQGLHDLDHELVSNHVLDLHELLRFHGHTDMRQNNNSNNNHNHHNNNNNNNNDGVSLLTLDDLDQYYYCYL